MKTPWSNFTRAVVIAVSLIFIVWLLYTIRPIIGPLIIAVLLAYTLNPLVNFIKVRLRLGHKWAVAWVYFSGLAALIIIPSLLAPVAIRQASRLSDNLHEIRLELDQILAQTITIAGLPLNIGQFATRFLDATGESLVPATEGALTVLETTSLGFVWLLVILVSIYYLLLDGDQLRSWLIGLAPADLQNDADQLLRQIDAIWRAYLYGTFVLMVVVTVVFSIAWSAIGLPGGVMLGVLMGLLTVIPDVGPAIAWVLSALVALFQGSNFLPMSNTSFALLVTAIYFVLIQIKGIWIRPRVMGRFLHMNEGIIFTAIIGATVLWGILGALLIVPLLASLGVIGRYIRCRLLHEPWPVVPPAATSSDAASVPDPVQDKSPQQISTSADNSPHLS